ncbi:hypothetical protein GmRootV118_28520 [Variovorax sp. V118]|uniref:hypothetical protein n=1 Tax=Variovorax sp. V118 TaxID=3065954 RepID=UPI0034E86BF1
MRTVFTVAAAIGVLSLGGCFASPSEPALSYEIAMCPEPLRISDCKLESSVNPSCTFENTSQQTLSGYPRAWGYDANGVQRSNFAITGVDGTMPGQKKRLSFTMGGEFKTVKRVVVCSLDPESPMVKSRITVVGIAQ